MNIGRFYEEFMSQVFGSMPKSFGEFRRSLGWRLIKACSPVILAEHHWAASRPRKMRGVSHRLSPLHWGRLQKEENGRVLNFSWLYRWQIPKKQWLSILSICYPVLHLTVILRRMRFKFFSHELQHFVIRILRWFCLSLIVGIFLNIFVLSNDMK